MEFNKFARDIFCDDVNRIDLCKKKKKGSNIKRMKTFLANGVDIAILDIRLYRIDVR